MDNLEADCPITPAGYPLAWIMGIDDVVWPDASDDTLHENTWGRMIVADRLAALGRVTSAGGPKPHGFLYTARGVSGWIELTLALGTDQCRDAIY